MSEPQAGSDLAAASARATRTDGGWVLSGTKVWTSGAHLSHQIVVLARTSPLDPQRRHAGFSQFIVPTDSPGIGISPIVLMSGEHHFNEVTFDEVFIDDTNLLGEGGRRLATGHRRIVLRTKRSGTDPDHRADADRTGPCPGRPGRSRPARHRGGRRAGGAGDLLAPIVGIGGT